MPEVTYYFNSDGGPVGKRRRTSWANPSYFVDNILTNYASTSSDGDTQLLDGNTCPGTDLGLIAKVELRAYGYGDGNDKINLTPVFPGGDGYYHEITPAGAPAWGSYLDITHDLNAPFPWTWADVVAIDVLVQYDKVGAGNPMYCAKVEIRVSYWVPPVSEIDVGAPAVAREKTRAYGYTRVDKNNPANAWGILHSVKVWAIISITGLKVGTFYATNGNTLKCRDSEVVGDVEAGAERTFTGLSIAVQAGDYIGCHYTAGYLAYDPEGYLGAWSVLDGIGEYIVPGAEMTYGFYPGNALSLYGYGDFGVAVGRSQGHIIG